jgi:hypothetical protein
LVTCTAVAQALTYTRTLSAQLLADLIQDFADAD